MEKRVFAGSGVSYSLGGLNEGGIVFGVPNFIWGMIRDLRSSLEVMASSEDIVILSFSKSTHQLLKALKCCKTRERA